MNRLKEWYFDGNGYKRQEKVIKAFSKWYRSNLRITRGSGNNVEEIFGLPYTSSSSYAALWNCQAEAELKQDAQWKFNALAITEDNKIIAIFDREDTGIFDDLEIEIGTI